MLRAECFILFTVFLSSTPSIACELLPEEIHYRIEHAMFGTIGEAKLTLQCEADLVVVDRTVDVDVRVFMASLYQRHAHYTEVWRAERLIRFEGHTDDNGERTTLAAEVISDDAIEIKGPGLSIRAPLKRVPTDPWHLKLVDQTLLFDRIDSRVFDVHVTDLGTDRLNIGRGWIDTRRFAVS